MINLESWSGKLDSYKSNNIGIISINVDNCPYSVYFDISVLRINNKECPNKKPLRHYVKLGTLLHFNAEKMRKPRYDLGLNVWYSADLVWLGLKPVLNNDSGNGDDSSSSGVSVLSENDPHVYDKEGEVVMIVNRNTAILKAKINKKKVFAVVERCRLYINGRACSKNMSNIANVIEVGNKMRFEAYQLKMIHPAGIKYHVSMAWVGFRPNVDLKRPVHALNLPAGFTLPVETVAVIDPGPSTSGLYSTGPSGAISPSSHRVDQSMNISAEELDAQSSSAAESCLVGLVVALPNASTAVIKSEIDSKPALIAVERCRLYIHHRICPSDISTILRLGTAVSFEAFPLGGCLPCGVEYRVSLAWLGQRPRLDLPHPSHVLDLPQVLSIDLATALQANLLK